LGRGRRQLDRPQVVRGSATGETNRKQAQKRDEENCALHVTSTSRDAILCDHVRTPRQWTRKNTRRNTPKSLPASSFSALYQRGKSKRPGRNRSGEHDG